MRIIVGFWGDPVPRRRGCRARRPIARRLRGDGAAGDGRSSIAAASHSQSPGLVRQLLAAHTQPSAEWIFSLTDTREPPAASQSYFGFGESSPPADDDDVRVRRLRDASRTCLIRRSIVSSPTPQHKSGLNFFLLLLRERVPHHLSPLTTTRSITFLPIILITSFHRRRSRNIRSACCRSKLRPFSSSCPASSLRCPVFIRTKSQNTSPMSCSAASAGKVRCVLPAAATCRSPDILI